MPAFHKASAAKTILLLFIGSLLLPGASSAQTPLLDLEVIDTLASSGAQNVPISVYMNNYEDTVAGYSFWLLLSRPDIASFQLTFDTVGTLSSSWELVQVNHLGGQPFNIKVVAVANWPPPPTTPGIAPQQGGLPLIKLLIDIQDIPDTTTNRTVDIIVAHANLSEVAFSDPGGTVIGTVQDSVLDTAYFECTFWQDETTCLEWTEVNPGAPYDSSEIYWRTFAVLDTTRVQVLDGSITITGGYACGNINNDPEGNTDISDLVYLVDWMFTGGPEPVALMSADCNGDGLNDISDLVWLVDFMFTGGPMPICGK
ncbi:MAG: hypothetical protein OEV80_14275 [candidate division Zixibacteria bacterium]|nr:hypothetical protein [candidate division Zixibacteria bacterium]